MVEVLDYKAETDPDPESVTLDRDLIKNHLWFCENFVIIVKHKLYLE